MRHQREFWQWAFSSCLVFLVLLTPGQSTAEGNAVVLECRYRTPAPKSLTAPRGDVTISVEAVRRDTGPGRQATGYCSVRPSANPGFWGLGSRSQLDGSLSVFATAYVCNQSFNRGEWVVRVDRLNGLLQAKTPAGSVVGRCERASPKF